MEIYNIIDNVIQEKEEEVVRYINREFKSEWRKWLYQDSSKSDIKVIIDSVTKYPEEVPRLNVGVMYYPEGDLGGYGNIVMRINMSILVTLDEEGNLDKIRDLGEVKNGILHTMIISGEDFLRYTKSKEHKYTSSDTVAKEGRVKGEYLTFKETNGGVGILDATRTYEKLKLKKQQEEDLYNKLNLKKVEGKEDLLRLQRMQSQLKGDTRYHVFHKEDNLLGHHLIIMSNALKDPLYITPNYILTRSQSNPLEVWYNKKGLKNNTINGAYKGILKQQKYSIKDSRKKRTLHHIFKTYEVSNDLRRSVSQHNLK